MTLEGVLARAALNVTSLERLTAFYVKALGFAAASAADQPDLARALGARRARSVLLRLGRQELELTELDPPARTEAPPPRACDLWFQHCALSTFDMKGAFDRLRACSFTPISTSETPVALPAASGGATAFKFRDPDGHPLELIAFAGGRSENGIDHSAIVASNVAASERFYSAYGFGAAHRQTNTGVEQGLLDGLEGARVKVVSLTQPEAALGIELLAYEHPRSRTTTLSPCDILASRLVFTRADAGGGASVLTRDPDGHLVLMSP